MLKLLKSPLLHCLIFGAVITAFQFSQKPLPTITITAQDINSLKEQINKSFGGGGQMDIEKIIQQLAEDEVVFQEAKAAGFDRSDTVKLRLANVADFLQIVPKESSFEQRYQAALDMKLDETDIVVRRQMITLYKTALKASINVAPPTRTQIEQYYQQHQQEFTQASRFAFSHVYIERSDDSGYQQALAIQKELNNNSKGFYLSDPEHLSKAIASGNVFYGGHHFNIQNQRQIARHFGEAFSLAVADADQTSWSQPIQSAFGWHVILIKAFTEAAPIPIDKVEQKIIRQLTLSSKNEVFNKKLVELQSRYTIKVEDDVSVEINKLSKSKPIETTAQESN